MIQDVQIIPLAAHMDDRGYLKVARHADDFEPYGVVYQFTKSTWW